MECPRCQCKLNRRFGIRETAVAFGFAVAGATVPFKFDSHQVPFVWAGGVVVYYLVDVCTVRLFRVRRFGWLAGYGA